MHLHWNTGFKFCIPQQSVCFLLRGSHCTYHTKTHKQRCCPFKSCWDVHTTRVRKTVCIDSYTTSASIVECVFHSSVTTGDKNPGILVERPTFVNPLTHRLLMSYIYIYGAPILDVSRSHTQRRTTVGRTPLDE